MPVKDWLPWVLGAGVVYVVVQGGAFRGKEEGENPLQVNLGDDLFGRARAAAGPGSAGDVLSQVFGGLTSLFQALPGVASGGLEIPLGPGLQAVNPFAVAPKTPVAATPQVTERQGVSGLGAAGALVREAVWNGWPVPEAVVTWVTTARRGENPNNSGRNFETNPLTPSEREQVRGAIGSNASVAKELVDAFNAGQGLGETAAPLVRNGLSVRQQLAKLRTQGGVPGMKEVAEALEGIVIGAKKRTEVGEFFSGGDLDFAGIEDIEGRVRQGFRFTPGGFQFPEFKVPPGGFLPEFKIPEMVTDPEGAIAGALVDAVSEVGSDFWERAEGPLTTTYRVTEGAAVGTDLALRAANRVPVVRAAVRPLAASTGLGMFGTLGRLLVVPDLIATVYEAGSGQDVPVLGWWETIRGIWYDDEGNFDFFGNGSRGLPRDAQGNVVA